jgi:hypothetical protein
MAHNKQRNTQTQIIKGNKQNTYEINKQEVLKVCHPRCVVNTA